MSKFIGLIGVKPGALTRARILQGLSQRELAQMVDYSVAHVSQLERGIRHPSPQAAQQLCRVLDKPFDELFYLHNVYKSEHKETEGEWNET
ncbi:helix-turn-helix domain-containing protein [Ferroacidibacillus organovorans]|uniref:HTH cro/C1-type domain-containing protein n=1 Tax=Ferroacidibacillus organovorans TaxID=1765683 RepID=A0A101XQT0_9BACL|nr:helix-turn-helix transcriptional regulator [Ferroacidibacillus organovorans]KUO95816.1 hypothetical protein ATW55_15080 [Ferroacidibacillus organovorans]